MKRLFSLVALIPSFAFAQDRSLDAWLGYFGNLEINKKINFHHEIQSRTAMFLHDSEHFLLRAGIGYNVNNSMNVLVGYGRIRTNLFPDTGDVIFTYTENRIYQQLLYKHSISRLNLQHRFRFEQRFVNDDFKMRLRYMISGHFPLNNKEMNNKTIYLSASNELFFNTTKDYFDRNRVFGGIGYKFSNKVRVELGYLYQYSEIQTVNAINLSTFVNLAL